MQAVNIIGMMEHIDEVITVLGESGVFHPDEVSNFYSDLSEFTHLQTKNSYAEPLTNLKTALNLTNRKFSITDTSDFRPSFEELESFSAQTTADIQTLIEQKETLVTKLGIAKHNLSIAEHFAGLDVEISKVLDTEFVSARFGRLPKESIKKLEAYKDNDYVDFAVCSEDRDHCWGVYFAPNDKADRIDKIFDGLYFEPTELAFGNESPINKLEEYKERIPVLKNEIEQAQRKIDAYLDDNSEQITKYFSNLEEMYLYSGIRTKAMQHGNSFIMVGWIPTENKKQIKKKLKMIVLK